MKVVRRITYEADDSDPKWTAGAPPAIQQTAERRLGEQLMKSLPVGTYDWLTRITVEHVEGPQWLTDGSESNSLRANTEGDV